MRQDVEDVLAPYYSYASCVYKVDVGELRRIVRCMEAVAREQFSAVLEEGAAAGSPAMVVHESDGFACNMWKTVTEVLGCKRVRRSGKNWQEVLLELLIAKTCSRTGELTQASSHKLARPG